MIYDFKYKYKPEEKILVKTPFIYNKLNNLLSKNGKNQKLKIKTTYHLKKNLRLKNSKIRLKSFFLITLSKFKPLVFYRIKKLKRRTIIFPKLLNQVEKKKLALRWYSEFIKESSAFTLDSKINEVIQETMIKSKKIKQKKHMVYKIIKENRTSIPLLKYYS